MEERGRVRRGEKERRGDGAGDRVLNLRQLLQSKKTS